MSRYDLNRSNKYNSTPRKVFDSYIDRMAVRRDRDKADHRADFAALFKRIMNLETQLTLLTEHLNKHCEILSGEDHWVDGGTEEL